MYVQDATKEAVTRTLKSCEDRVCGHMPQAHGKPGSLSIDVVIQICRANKLTKASDAFDVLFFCCLGRQ